MSGGKYPHHDVASFILLRSVVEFMHKVISLAIQGMHTVSNCAFRHFRKQKNLSDLIFYFDLI